MITEGKLPFGDIIEFKEDSEIVERRKTQGKWNAEILKKHTNNRTWIEIIEKCLNPDPRMRFQTANEVLQKLSGYKPGLINQNAIWKLIVLVGPDKGKEYNITNLSHYKNKRILTIGRVDEHNPFMNDVPVYETSSSFISLHHGTLECIIRDKTPTWYLRDGQWYSKDGVKGWYLSTNGVKVNDTKVNQFGIELKANDIIKIGKIVLKIICE
jgi:serine/threonine protein kinase